MNENANYIEIQRGRRKVGEWASGFVFTQEDYNRILEKCVEEGTFELEE